MSSIKNWKETLKFIFDHLYSLFKLIILKNITKIKLKFCKYTIFINKKVIDNNINK